MTIMWPLTTKGKRLDLSAPVGELTGFMEFVRDAGRAGLPSPSIKRGFD